MKVLIGTKNAGKVEGLRRALAHYYDDVEIEMMSAPSNVAEQPIDADTLIGAQNRVKNLKTMALSSAVNHRGDFPARGHVAENIVDDLVEGENIFLSLCR